MAAEQGYAAAQYELGIGYENGQGVPLDYVRAYMWQLLAVSSSTGDDADEASANRDIIAQYLTPQKIAEAQALAMRCQQSNYQDCD